MPEDTKSLIDAEVAQGEMALLQGDASGMEHFEKAIALDPKNPLLFYRQGLALFELGSQESKKKTLLLASKKFKAATQLNPKMGEAWQAWGNVLFLLGKIYGEHHYFRGALEKYQKASALGESNADLHWDLGVIWTRMGGRSKEALDLHLAIAAFQKASTLQEALPAVFWHDFGIACYELAKRTNDQRLFYKGASYFRQSLAFGGAHEQGWRALAKCLEKLYSETHEEELFAQANDCFSEAANLSPQEASIWFEWARFLYLSGKRNLDIKRLRTSIEKCHRAYALDPKSACLIATEAETLALLGALTDRVDYIYEAQNKLSEATDLAPDMPEIYDSYGLALMAFAHYFQDPDYYHQAIEKFQMGLSIDRTSSRLWHGLGICYSIAGNIDGSHEDFEKAIRFLTKAIDLAPSTDYLFDFAVALSRCGQAMRSQECLEDAISHFEHVIKQQKNGIMLHPEWLFEYGIALDALGDFHEEESHYVRALEIFSHVLTIDPDFPQIHYELALTFSHLGDLLDDVDHFQRALHHYRLALKRDEDNDAILADWGLALINLAEHSNESSDASRHFRDAESKLILAAKLGNIDSYYSLACLYSLLGQYEKAMTFLLKADKFGALPPLDEIQNDEWLEGLHSTPDFREFLSALERR